MGNRLDLYAAAAVEEISALRGVDRLLSPSYSVNLQVEGGGRGQCC